MIGRMPRRRRSHPSGPRRIGKSAKYSICLESVLPATTTSAEFYCRKIGKGIPCAKITSPRPIAMIDLRDEDKAVVPKQALDVFPAQAPQSGLFISLGPHHPSTHGVL